MKKALAALPCVRSEDDVTIDIDTKSAKVVVLDESYDQAALEKALADAGQPGTVQTSDESGDNSR